MACSQCCLENRSRFITDPDSCSYRPFCTLVSNDNKPTSTTNPERYNSIRGANDYYGPDADRLYSSRLCYDSQCAKCYDWFAITLAIENFQLAIGVIPLRFRDAFSLIRLRCVHLGKFPTI